MYWLVGGGTVTGVNMDVNVLSLAALKLGFFIVFIKDQPLNKYTDLITLSNFYPLSIRYSISFSTRQHTQYCKKSCF